MKKNILFKVVTMIVLFVLFSININATTAKAPSAIPDENDTLYAILDDKFDFSKISFASSDAAGTPIVGHNYMRKIILTANPSTIGTTKEEKIGDSWFTVYCLDGELKFPMYSYTNFEFGSGMPDSVKLQTIMMFALFNNIDLYEQFSTAKGYVFDPSITYTLASGVTDTSALASLEEGNEVVVNIQKIQYADATAGIKSITAADLSKNAEATNYELKLKKSDLQFDKYTAKKMSGEDYNHALWILEHSYPTLDLTTSLSLAGGNYDTLVTEIKALHDGETKTDDEWAALVENYVYSTIQYAIWKSNGGIDLDGKKLGSTLTGSTQLNLLYGYLIADRSEYKNYSNFQFSNTLKLKQPTAGKEIFKETDDNYIYGPYTAGYDLVSINDVTVSVGNADKTGISIVDADGNEISKISPNQAFYVKCSKSAKIANVKINLSTSNALTFYPSFNRGRIYYAYYPLTQNVVSGGKIVTTNIEKSFDLIFNPKTGVENIAIIFVITLVAFSLGYIALSYKSKPISLN